MQLVDMTTLYMSKRNGVFDGSVNFYLFIKLNGGGK